MAIFAITMEWKDVIGYEGIYKVSSDGQIKTLSRPIYVGGKLHYTQKEKILKQSLFRVGYNYISLHKEGATKVKTVHSIVAEAFLPNPENKRTVNHKNGIKTDNRIENLEWASDAENNIHAYETGLKKRFSLIGENIATGKKIYFECVSDALPMGFKQQSISMVCSGDRQSHKGYKFYYCK